MKNHLYESVIRDVYGDSLAQLGAQNNRVVVLEADVGSSTKSCVFGKQFPSRYFNVGIAEINMAAMAAGFASSGFIPFINTFAVFMSTRAADPMQSLAAYDNLNVKFAAAYCGLSDSYDGASHHAITDMAFVRALPNMTVLSPCDAVQTQWAVQAAASVQGPVYLRLTRATAPDIYDSKESFEIGKGKVLCEGDDITIVAVGSMVSRALQAAELLQLDGVSASVIDMHTVKPLDEQLMLHYAAKTGAVVTAEEHSVCGGLGSAVAELLSQERPTPMGMVGLNGFCESGDYDALVAKYRLDAKAIKQKCIDTLSLKKRGSCNE